MRLFLAIELPDDVLDALEQAVAPLQSEFPELAWVKPTKRHLTLKFLGDVANQQVRELESAMSHAASRHRPFAMELAGFGAFPTFRRARVLWVGVQQEPRLELLHHDVEVAGESVGFEIDGRAFRPHITLARVRERLEVEQAKKLSRASKRIDFSASVPVENVTLFESVLGAGGSQYHRVHMASLAGGR